MRVEFWVVLALGSEACLLVEEDFLAFFILHTPWSVSLVRFLKWEFFFFFFAN